MAETWGFRPSDFWFGGAREAALDQLVWGVRCEIDNRIASEEERHEKAKPGEIRRQVMRGLVRAAKREEEARSGEATDRT
jgi:hypothetical protein